MKKKVKIFVGSSSEPKAMEIAESVGDILEEVAEEVKYWDYDTFRASHDILGDLYREVEACDGGVFICNEDDILYKGQREEENNKSFVARDNVLFEAGMFCGAKGKNGVVLYSVGKTLIPSDLAGITVIKDDMCQDKKELPV